MSESRTADEATTDILCRLRSVEGHVRGIVRMVEDGAYCIDIVHQIHAAEKALRKVSSRVLARHLQSCVTDAIRGDDPGERDRVIGEILEVLGAAERG